LVFFSSPSVSLFESASAQPFHYHCILCSVSESNANALLTHMVLTHNLVIADVTKIADLPRYLNYWKKRMQDEMKSGNGDVEAVLKIFTSQIVTRAAPTPNAVPMKSYYLLSNVLPEDQQLRTELQQQKLEEILEKQKKERSDISFEKRCLFCSSVFKGDRNMLIAHMFQAHQFNIGRPDNLVDVAEFIDLLQLKLDSLQCLYCEKTYKSSLVLKQHIRKKKHFKLNPKNNVYDKFYVVNYLEPGKNWQEVQKALDAEPEEEDTDSTATSTYTESGSEMDDEDKNEEEDWDDWEEEDEEFQKSVCLFCTEILPSPDAVLVHCKHVHQFDIRKLRASWNLDCYACIRLINYIRRRMVERICPLCEEGFGETQKLVDHMKEQGHCGVKQDHPFFKDPQYLFPTYENDSLLFVFDIGDDHEEYNEEQELLRKQVQEDLMKRKDVLFKELAKLGIVDEHGQL